MKKLVNNNYIDALLKTILFSAITHLIILYTKAFVSKDKELINIFNILDLELIWPSLIENSTSFILSYLFIGVVYCIFLFWKKSSD